MSVALVTGGAKRIGKAFVLSLAKQGYDIALHYHSATEEQQQTRALIEKEGVACLSVQADLTQQQDISSLFPHINQQLGPCNLLINNASVFNPISFGDTTEAQFNVDMAINLHAPFFLTKYFTDQATNGGHIINMLDCRISGISTRHFIYSLSKYALYHLTLMSARELAPDIRVNAIAPGPALPPPDKTEQHLTNIVNSSPLGIASPPTTLVQALEYLIAAETVTGQVLFVDSGLHLGAKRS